MNRSLYKIVHTASRNVWADTEKRILREALWMEEQGHLVIIIAPLDCPLYLKAKDKGIAVYAMSFKPFARIGESGRIRRILETEKPFVVNCHGRADAKAALKAAQRASVPLRIMSRHTGNALKNSRANRNLFKKRSHYVFTTSKDTRQHVQKRFNRPDMEIFSIPDAIVEPESLLSREHARQKLTASLGLAHDTTFIGVLGEIPPQKDLQILFDLIKSTACAASCHLVFSADPASESQDKLAAMASAAGLSGRVHHGSKLQETPWTVYRALECAIHPGVKEQYPGIPTELLEAMYARCPVIGADIAGIRDVLAHDHTGFLFSRSDAESLSAMVSLSLERRDVARQKALTAEKIVKKNHTMDAMGRDVIRIYRLHQVRMERMYKVN